MKTIVKMRLPRVFAGKVDITPALLRVGYALRDRVNVYPSRKHGMKIRWKSKRQRRYVLANIRLPYARRGWLAKQWLVTPVSPRRVVVRNTAKYAAFVIGRAQQPFHTDRGWRRADVEAKRVTKDRVIIRDVARIIENQLKR